jgi:polysaccharide biosynthesis protein PelE
MNWLYESILLLKTSNSNTLMLLLLLGNALFSALVARLALNNLPYKEPKQQRLLWLLLTCAGACIPLIGVLAVASAMIAGMRWKGGARLPGFNFLGAPRFDLAAGKDGSHFDRGGLRSRLVKSAIPTETRLQSISALQHLPTVATSSVLRTLLDDPVEDIRLVAFGMLDKEEKQITGRIHKLLNRPPLDNDSPREHFLYNKQLAELYWELAYSGIVQGDLREYTLNNALDHANSSLSQNDADPGLLFLIARILNALGRVNEAIHHMHRAMTLGLPKHRALPYLAEMAFERGDYGTTWALLSEIGNSPVTPRLRPVVDYWTRTQTKS